MHVTKDGLLATVFEKDLDDNGVLIIPKEVRVVSNNAIDKTLKNKIKGVLFEGGAEKETEIENWAFADCRNLEVVAFSDNVASIGYCAFASCEKLRHIYIPSSVKKIGGNCFSGCKGMKEIHFSANLGPQKDFRGYEILNIFAGCDGVEKAVVYGMNYEEAIYAGNTILAGCKNLKELSFEDMSKCFEVDFWRAALCRWPEQYLCLPTNLYKDPVVVCEFSGIVSRYLGYRCKGKDEQTGKPNAEVKYTKLMANKRALEDQKASQKKPDRSFV